MTKEYKVEPPELVRQMWEAGLVVDALDGKGRVGHYLSADVKDESFEDWPPSWVKEIEPERINADRIKEGAPVAVREFEGEAWYAGYFFIGCFKNHVVVLDDMAHQIRLATLWKQWCIPSYMDPEEWKREWLLPTEEQTRMAKAQREATERGGDGLNHGHLANWIYKRRTPCKPS